MATYPRERARPVRPTPEAPARKRELTAAVRRLWVARMRCDQFEELRDEAIRTAHAAGVPPSDIAQITDLSPQRVAQIRRAARL